MPPGVPMKDMRNGFRSSDCAFYWLHFSAEFSSKLTDEEYLDIYSKNDSKPNDLYIPQKKPTVNMDKIIVLMKQLQDAVRSDYSAITLGYMTTLILCEVHNQNVGYQNATSEKKSQQQLINDILDYVKRHIGKNIKVADIARHFGYNEKYLSHRFQSLFGVSLKKYIMRAKIDEANFMLTDTNMTILEISMALGFSDSHNFMKFYKRMTELTPSEYRNAFSQRMLFHK